MYRTSSININLCAVGGSTAAGVPFNEKISIPKIVSYAFNDSLNSKKINIHNLAEPGMPISTAYWKTRELTLGSDSGIMLLYAGINDPYKKENYNENLKFFKMLQKSWVLSKIHYKINPWNNSKEKFEFYYEEILKMLIEKNWLVISSTLVGNYTEFSPNITNEELFSSKLYQQTFHNSSNCGNYIENVNKLIQEYKNPYLYYKKAEFFIAQNNIDSASHYFKIAIDEDYSKRPSSYKNSFIQSISKTYKISTIDPFQLFYTLSNNQYPGYSMFMDAHHPNLEGYILISNLFIDKLSKHYNTASTNKTDISFLIDFLELDNHFFANAYTRTAAWHILESFYSLEFNDRLEKAAFYLNEAKKLDFESSHYNFWNSILLILQNDFKRWQEFYSLNEQSIDYSYQIKNVPNFSRIEIQLTKGIELNLINEKDAKSFLSKLK